MTFRDRTLSNSALLGLSVLLALALAVLYVGYTFVNVTSIATQLNLIEEEVEPVRASALELPGYSKIAVAPAAIEAEALAPAAPAITVATATNQPPAAPIGQPATSPRAVAMTAAGIQETDQPIAERLASDASVIALQSCRCARQIDPAMGLTERYLFLDQYVRAVHGSWATAEARFAERGIW